MRSSCARTLPRTLSTTPCAEMFGEIFLCEFPFTSGATSKIRPALVLFDLQQDALICRVTSVVRSNQLDIPLLDWHVWIAS